ncbi:MAG: helix-turn-helix domain-containing protein [Thermoguttaceae bacterium]|jgi:AAA+ superfamily predicted ATPase
MSEDSTELIETIRKIHGLLELLAEDKIAQRDAKQRATLREIVGASTAKQKSILLMDGTRTQKEIRDETSVDQGNFSRMVGKMIKAKLLVGDTKTPKLNISIPPNFFETNAETE